MQASRARQQTEATNLAVREPGRGVAGARLQHSPADVATSQQGGASRGGCVLRLITDVDPAGPAAEAGLAAGDLILEANRQPVRSITDLKNAVSKGGQSLLLLVNRRGTTLFMTLQE